MNNEIQNQEENNTEQVQETHYGRMVSIVITVIALGVVAWLGMTGGLSDLGKDTVVAPEVQDLNTGAVLAPVVPYSPVEKFVITNVGAPVVGSQKQNIATADTSIFKAPENFKSFTYDASVGKKISVSGNCSDEYYILLVFSSAVDYRKNPSAALANKGFECPKSKLFNIEMNLQEINLRNGSYYVFIADQGSKGSWYNPR